MKLLSDYYFCKILILMLFLKRKVFIFKPFAGLACLSINKLYRHTQKLMKQNYLKVVFRLHFYTQFLIAVAVSLVPFTSQAQITVNTSNTAAALAQELVGTGVVVMNPTITCPSLASGIFHVTSSNLGFDSGVVLSSGYANTVWSTYGTNSAATNFASHDFSAPGDADLATLTSNNATHDACVLQFDFIPSGDTIKFDYVFGSEEYPGYTCSSFDDAFGFFISGPGYATRTNIALVPGTTIPVSINSVNSGTASPGYNISTCHAVGTGSPFPAYFRNNTSSSTVTYDGLTVIMTAIAHVTPCDTYHLKLGVCDANDGVYDSGVWLKAGSLNSVNTRVYSVGGAGLAQPVNYCVRGCQPGQFVLKRPVADTLPLTIRYLIAGNAINGTDYTHINDSVIILAGDTQATVYIQGLPEPTPLGPKIVQLYIYSPYACAGTTPAIVDSAIITIYDSIVINILTHDTAICRYDSVNIHTFADSVLTYQWVPTTGISNPNAKDVTARPLVTTTYHLAANLALTGCYPVHDSITITVDQTPTVDAGPNSRSICLGMSIPFITNVSPANQAYTYSWSPGTYLSSTTIPNPVSTPTSVGNIRYVLIVSPTAVGCNGYDTINVRILPNDFNLLNHDTAICRGASVQVRAIGDTNFHYQWSPYLGVSDTISIMPIIKPDTTQTYTITGTFPGCPAMVHSFNIDVQPNPTVLIGANKAICEWDTAQLNPLVTPDWYQKYIYSWTPVADVNISTRKQAIFIVDSTATLTLKVTTPAGCTGSDSINILVHQGNFGKLLTFADTGVCPLISPLQILADGGVSYHWSPEFSINNASIANPQVIPVSNTIYTGIITDQYGCHDTLTANIIVYPRAVLELEDSAVIYPGESYEIKPMGNALHYKWSPPIGLSSDSVANPIAQPAVNTLYKVTATTENGCSVTDSINLYVDPNTLLALPNAFLPGYGPNGELKIIKRGIATLKYFRIFNRWGVEVFSTSDIDKGWNGTFDGTPQPVGVYVYIVEAYTNTGSEFKKQGNVTLIR